MARSGSAIQRRPDGRVSDVHDAKRGMDIHHGLNGGQRVSVERADHSRIVAERGRPGFVQRPYSFHGRDYAQRSYYFHGQMHEVYYRGYQYRGFELQVYAPLRYYPAAFYGWTFYPWGMPVSYAWGYVGSPWVGYYGSYFAPASMYGNASLWLTDYMISSDLAAAYDAGKEAGALSSNDQLGNSAPALTPEIKQMIADEVRAQIALESADSQQNLKAQDVDPASSSIARTLGDGHIHTLVVGSPLDVIDDSGTECALSDGDVLRLTTAPPPDAAAISLTVVASKGGIECSKSGTVTVSVADLQEMQNQMRQAMDRGLDELRAQQGKGGLPVVPASATAAPASTAFADVAPPPNPNDAKDIDQQAKAADQSENEVTAQAKQGQ